MTPGFDTNGDDSSRDDDVHSLSLGSLFSKTTPNDDEAENPTRSTPLRIPQSRNDIASQVASSRKPNFPLKFKDNTHRSKQVCVNFITRSCSEVEIVFSSLNGIFGMKFLGCVFLYSNLFETVILAFTLNFVN